MFIEAIIVLVCCAGSSFFLYRMIIKTLEKNPDKNDLPKYYSCVEKGDMYCQHIHWKDWCDTEIHLYPEQYQEEMKSKENEQNQDK